MSSYANIKRCLELSDRDIASAVGDRRLAKALLDQLAKVSRPGDGAPKLLLVFARLASASGDWIEGALRVEMIGDADVTVVEVLSELGLGMRERVFPSFKMGVPLEEFVRAVERVPHMIAPLTIATSSERRLVLTAVVEGEEDEAGVDGGGRTPAVSIGHESLYTGEPRDASKDKLAAVKDPGTRIQPRTTEKEKPGRKGSKPHIEVARPRVVASGTGKTLQPVATPVATPGDVPITMTPQRIAPPPLSVSASGASSPASALRIAPGPIVPRAPPLPRTDERTPEPGPAPGGRRTIVARVPLTKVQVARGSRPPSAKPAPPTRASKPPKRASLRPAAEAPKRPSMKPAAKATPSKPPGRGSKAPPGRSTPPKSIRASRAASEPPDEEGIDGGWEDD